MLSRSLYLCLSLLANQPLSGPPANGTNPASHTYQLCQWQSRQTGRDLYKRASPSFGLFIQCSLQEESTSRGNSSSDIWRREEQRLTAQPWCLVDWTLHLSAEHAASRVRPATAQISAATIHRLSPAPSGTCTLVANWTSLHYTAGLLYAAANITGENPVAGTETKLGILATALRDCTTLRH